MPTEPKTIDRATITQAYRSNVKHPNTIMIAFAKKCKRENLLSTEILDELVVGGMFYRPFENALPELSEAEVNDRASIYMLDLWVEVARIFQSSVLYSVLLEELRFLKSRQQKEATAMKLAKLRRTLK